MAKKDIPWHEIEKYLKLGATLYDVSVLTGISKTNLQTRLLKEKGLHWTDYAAKHQTELRMSLRSRLVSKSKWDTNALLFAVKSLGGLMEAEAQEKINLEDRKVKILEQIDQENDEVLRDDIINALLDLGGEEEYE